MQKLEPKMGDRVIVRAVLERSESYGRDDQYRPTRLKTWERKEFLGEAWQRGIYVGRRRKSNGSTVYHGIDEGTEYRPVAYFEVWLVAYSESRELLVCLPKDVEFYD